MGADTSEMLLYQHTHGMRNKQDKLGALVLSQSYNTISISETWWNESYNWSAGMEGYQLFKRVQQGRRGAVALHVREKLDCIVLAVSDDGVKSLWVRIKGMDSKSEVFVGVYY